MEKLNKLISTALIALLLLPACAGGSAGREGGKLIITAPAQARTGETVVIKVTDERGRPVEKAHFTHGYVGGTGATNRNGEVAIFFPHVGTYEYLVTKPGLCEEKRTIKIISGVVELGVFGGIHIGPPPVPGQPVHANNYRPGMPVQIRVKNIGHREITLPNSAPWKINTFGGEAVFTPVSLQVVVSLAPGETKEWSWEQKDNNGNQVKEGTYLVVLNCSEGEYRCLFTIVMERLQ